MTFQILSDNYTWKYLYDFAIPTWTVHENDKEGLSSWYGYVMRNKDGSWYCDAFVQPNVQNTERTKVDAMRWVEETLRA